MGMIPSLIVTLLISLINLSNGLFNFYLTSQQVHKLLGVEAELYFIRNGKPNNNAFKFLITVPADHDNLQFTWQNLINKSLNYEIEIEQSNVKDGFPVTLDIVPSGSIPVSSVQTFSLHFACVASDKPQKKINAKFSVKAPISDYTFEFHLRKHCDLLQTHKGQVIEQFPGYRGSFGRILYSVVIATLIFALMISLFAIYPYYINKKPGIKDVTNMHYKNLAVNLPNGSSENFSGISNNTVLSNRNKNLQERISELTVQRYRVRLGNILLQGAFGRIYQATYINDDGEEESVVVKTVANHASETQISLLLQEGMSMYSLDHENILTILRVSIQDHSAPFLLFPIEDYNNLKIFLQKCKLSAESMLFSLTTQEVVNMAFQITDALYYLHKKNLIHKDIAARNCVVRSKLKVQVTDNALSRDLFPADYHCLEDNENRPVKWSAFETLCSKTFTKSSDIWSFGVLLWELTTLAQQPYVDVDPFEMVTYLKDGYRLAQPVNCPDELYALMTYCWAIDIEQRPTLSQLQICLQDFSTQLSNYV